MLLARISFSLSHLHYYHPSLPVGLTCYILYLYRALADKFGLVVLNLCTDMKGSIGKSRLWVHPYSFSSIQHVLIV